MKKHVLIFFILIGCAAFNPAIAQVNYKWVKSISSTGVANDKGYSIAVDNAGFVYVTGSFGGGIAPADFNPFGPQELHVGAGISNCFFAKYNTNGDCVWAKVIDAGNSSNGSLGTSIAVDTAGNVYLAGAFYGTVDFNPSNQISNLMASSGDLDGFVAKYDSNGNYKWVRSQGGLLFDIANSVALDVTGNVYVAGVFKSANFESQGNTFPPFISIGSEDIFFAKYDSAGVFKWSKPIGGASRDIVKGIAIDAMGNAYLTGSFQGSVDFDPGTATNLSVGLGNQDAIFYAKYDSFGGYLFAKKLITNSLGSGIGTSIAVDAAGKLYITGSFSGVMDFSPVSGQLRASLGAKDMFYAKYNQLGEYEFANPISTPISAISDSAIGYGIVVDHIGNIYITGAFQGQADFDPSSADGTHTSSTGGGDIFFAKYDNTGNYLWSKSLCTGLDDAGTGIAVDTSGSVYVTGYYQETVNFDVGAGVANRVSSVGAQDIFFAKYSPGGTSTISGNVYDNIGNPVTAGYVYLYTQYTNDGNEAMHLVAITSIQLAGDYAFPDIYADNYIVLAIADSVTYPMLAATYYSDSTHWQQATHINTLPLTTFSTADINMRGLLSLNGSASLGGVILEGVGYDRLQGEPIVKIPIGLEGDPGSIIAYTSTDIDGKYTFNNLPAGCYKIYVNIPGLPMDSTYHECLDSLEIVTNRNFIADSGSIYIDPIVTGVEQIVASNIKVSIYPNPHKGTATIEFTMHETSMVKLELFNLLGEKVAELLNEQKPAGSVKYKFNATNAGLNAGIYLLNLKVGDEISSKKIIQIE